MSELVESALKASEEVLNNLKVSNLQAYEVPIEEIYCDNVFNSRGAISGFDVDDLVSSIASTGLLEPIAIQPWTKIPGKKWRIILGHRRYMAFLSLKKKTIPATILEGLSELEAKKLNIEENLKRKQLNILQEAKAIEVYYNAGWKAKEIAEDLKQPEPWVRTRLALLRLPDLIQAEAAAGILTQDHIKQLVQIKNPEKQLEAVKKVKESKLAGERKKIEVREKPKNPFIKKKRERHEIFAMINTIKDVVGFGFYTRVLGWAAGEVSELEIHRELQEFARSNGIEYTIPKEIETGIIQKMP